MRLLALILIVVLAPACGTEIRTDPDEAPPLDGPRASVPLSGEFGEGPGAGASPLPDGRGGALTTVLYSEHDAEITARIAGEVAAVHSELGETVAPGQLLATLADEGEEAHRDAAEASLTLARSQQERARGLLDARVITEADFEEVDFRFRDAEAALRQATARWEYRRTRAPFEGVVTRRFIRTGQYVDEGDPLFRVTLLRPLRARVGVPESLLDRLAPGDSTAMRGVGGETVWAIVARVAPAVDPASGTVEVLFDIPDPGRLLPGSTVSVTVPDAPPPPDGER